jgi:uncharacterized protein YbjT (DUF2867 family)
MELVMKCLLGLFTVAAVANTASVDVLVVGGTGRLGAPIVHLLVEAGYPVTVFVRSSSDRSRLDGLKVTYVTGDLMESDTVKAALSKRQFRFVIDASARGNSVESFYDTAMRNILDALQGSQVRQFILHGSVGAGDNMKQFPNIPFDRMRDVMIAKGEAEAMLKASGIDYTIIRNGRVQVDGTPATGTAQLTEDVAVMGTITRADLAVLTMECLDNPDCMNRTFHAVDDSY